jgi:hypothetical protein
VPDVLDHLLLHRALEGEIELLQSLARREARRLDPVLAPVGFPRGDLGGEHRLQEALVGPFLGAGALGELGDRTRCSRRLQRPKQVVELSRLRHAGISSS